MEIDLTKAVWNQVLMATAFARQIDCESLQGVSEEISKLEANKLCGVVMLIS